MRFEDLAGYSGQAVALIGGTFDPIHYGHMLLAERAREQYELDLVVFVPNRLSPLKENDDVAAAEHRYAMVELAVADNSCFAVCRDELDRPGPSYSIQTIRALRRILPVAVRILFVTGADAILELPEWHEPEAILEEAQVVAAARPGFNLDSLDSILGESRAGKIDILPMPALGISSTDIRERVSRGQNIRYLTPPAVIHHICEHGLYGARQPAAPDIAKQ